MNRSHPRFIADVMLGRLAKWLRIVGCDVVYDNSISDDHLINRALREDRIILTRDSRMVQRRKAKKHILIESDFLIEQLKQVFRQANIHLRARLFTRCLSCNRRLKTISKENIKDRVPPYVYKTQEKFSVCPTCDKVYWAGTHKDKILRELTKLNP